MRLFDGLVRQLDRRLRLRFAGIWFRFVRWAHATQRSKPLLGATGAKMQRRTPRVLVDAPAPTPYMPPVSNRPGRVLSRPPGDKML